MLWTREEELLGLSDLIALAVRKTTRWLTMLKLQKNAVVIMSAPAATLHGPSGERSQTLFVSSGMSQILDSPAKACDRSQIRGPSDRYSGVTRRDTA